MVRTIGLSRDFRVGSEIVHALKNADIECTKGTITLFMGPSGSGKSTALKVIGGMLIPTSGVVEVNGANLPDLKEKDLCSYRYCDVGIIFQDFMILEHLSVWDNILLSVRVGDKKLRKDEHEYYERADKLMKDLGLDGLKRRKAGTLSGGQRQRVAIARALLKEPSVILADEPTANLDTETALGVVSLLKRITSNNNTVTIIATHDERLSSMADCIYRFEDGDVKKE